MLHTAVRNNDIDQVRVLLRDGADANAHDTYDQSPLYHAASIKIAMLLLEHGANIHARNYLGDTPLHIAVINGNIEIVMFLLEHVADVDARTSESWTPLHTAAETDNIEAAKLLLEQGANIYARTSYGCTPLHIAAYNSSAGAIMLHQEHGASFHARTYDGLTPLHIAARNGHIETAKLLAAYAIQAAWRAYRRSRAARVIQSYWVRAYWDPDYRVCQARLHRDFAALAAEAAH